MGRRVWHGEGCGIGEGVAWGRVWRGEEGVAWGGGCGHSS